MDIADRRAQTERGKKFFFCVKLSNKKRREFNREKNFLQSIGQSNGENFLF